MRAERIVFAIIISIWCGIVVVALAAQEKSPANPCDAVEMKAETVIASKNLTIRRLQEQVDALQEQLIAPQIAEQRKKAQADAAAEKPKDP